MGFFKKLFLGSFALGFILLGGSGTQSSNMFLQGGEYLISFGVTGYEGDDFQVYHRLYDAIAINVVSDKNTVGFYDMNSRIEVVRK